MTDRDDVGEQGPFDAAETAAVRSVLDDLLTESKLYTQSKDYMALLDFVVKLRTFAPFNALLLQVQKPGPSYAATAADWWERFERKPKEGARPLLILWPFGPVALVYDVMDTEGKDLPRDVASYFASGSIDNAQLSKFQHRLAAKKIAWISVDAGDNKAGAIQAMIGLSGETEVKHYRLLVNRNHPPSVQFCTLVHELGHLFLGHLGSDYDLSIPDRYLSADADIQKELEAESVAYLVCARNGVQPASETYLKDYVSENTTIDNLDIYQVMRAAGRIESVLGLQAIPKGTQGT